MREFKLTELFEHFVADREYQGLSKQSIRFYRQSWEKFQQFAGTEPKLDRLTIQQYLISLQQTHKPVSVASRWRGLKIFLNWCFTEEYTNFDPKKIKNPKVPHTKKQPLSASEVMKMLETTKNPRDKAIIALLFDTGLRSKEICGLRVEDVDLTNRCVYVSNGKGGKDRTVPFSPSALRDLRKWCVVRVKDSPWFFHNFKEESGRQLAARWLHGLINMTAKRAGISGNVGAHRLRHTYARCYIANNGNAMVLKEMLGHSSIAVTQRYVNLSLEDLKKSHEQHSPLTAARMARRE